VHLFRRTDYRIDWASLDAFCTANTNGFVNHDNLLERFSVC
jgi:hypothetical protein